MPDSYYRILRNCVASLFGKARLQMRRLRAPGQVLVDGVRLEIPSHASPRIRELLYAGRYENGWGGILREKLSAADVVLESGTGIGFTATTLCRIVGSDRVFSLEANPALIAQAQRTFALNGVSPQLKHAAVWITEGPIEFNLADDFIGSSLCSMPTKEKVAVPGVDINGEIDRVTPTALLLDVEGAERELIPHIIWKDIRKVFLEIHPEKISVTDLRSIRGHLTKQGFTVDITASRGNLLFLEKL